MSMIFVNQPVKDLEASQAFFGALGFDFNAQFTDEDCACMIVDDNIFVMMLAEDRFRDFINGEIADPGTTEQIICLAADSRQQVDELHDKAIAAGVTAWKPKMDAGPMYGASFQDLDGHVWELMHMSEG